MHDSFGFKQFMFYVFSISAICLLSLKPVRDRNIAFEKFSKENFKPEFSKDTSSDIQNGTASILTKFCSWLTQNNIKSEEDERNPQNVIIFGDYFPFLGAGIRIRNWNFVTDLSKPKKDLKPLSKPKNKEKEGNKEEEENKEEKKDKDGEISLGELYKAVYNKINTKKLPNLSYQYILFADGNRSDEINSLLKDKSKPCTYHKNLKLLTDQLVGESKESIQSESIESYFEICKEGVFKNCRTYFYISHQDKNRSTLFSTLLRFSKIEKELFAECSFYVLTPIDENIYNIDRLPRNHFFAIKSIIITIILIIVYISYSWLLIPPLILLIFAVYPLFWILIDRVKESEYKVQLEQIKRGGVQNYGLLNTFRETIASPDYMNYFSAQDLIFIQNTLEKAIIDSVADLLDSKNIDSSFLRDEMISYINNGIIQYGGKMENPQNINGDKNKIFQGIKEVAQR